MGFFGRLLRGEPIYQPGDEDRGLRPEAPAPDAGVVPGQQPAAPVPLPEEHEVPIVRIGRIEQDSDPGRLNIYVDIKNESHQEVLLDKIHLLESHRELDRRLRPGESHQFLVYNGPALTHQPGGYAKVQFRAANGEYYEALHEIRSDRQSDNTYVVRHFLLRTPIRRVE